MSIIRGTLSRLPVRLVDPCFVTPPFLVARNPSLSLASNLGMREFPGLTTGTQQQNVNIGVMGGEDRKFYSLIQNGVVYPYPNKSGTESRE